MRKTFLILMALFLSSASVVSAKDKEFVFVDGDKRIEVTETDIGFFTYYDDAPKKYFDEYNEVPVWVEKDTNYPEIITDCKRFRDAEPNALHLVTACKVDSKFLVVYSEGVDAQDLYAFLRIYYASGEIKTPLGFKKEED